MALNDDIARCYPHLNGVVWSAVEGTFAMTRDARLSALHRGDFSPGAALPSPALSSGSVQRAPRSQVVVPGGRLPVPPGASGYEPPPQDATPRSAFRIVSRRRPR